MQPTGVSGSNGAYQQGISAVKEQITRAQSPITTTNNDFSIKEFAPTSLSISSSNINTENPSLTLTYESNTYDIFSHPFSSTGDASLSTAGNQLIFAEKSQLYKSPIQSFLLELQSHFSINSDVILDFPELQLEFSTHMVYAQKVTLAHLYALTRGLQQSKGNTVPFKAALTVAPNSFLTQYNYLIELAQQIKNSSESISTNETKEESTVQETLNGEEEEETGEGDGEGEEEGENGESYEGGVEGEETHVSEERTENGTHYDAEVEADNADDAELDLEFSGDLSLPEQTTVQQDSEESNQKIEQQEQEVEQENVSEGLEETEQPEAFEEQKPTEGDNFEQIEASIEEGLTQGSQSQDSQGEKRSHDESGTDEVALDEDSERKRLKV